MNWRDLDAALTAGIEEANRKRLYADAKRQQEVLPPLFLPVEETAKRKRKRKAKH